jgi:hypothetical protein
MSDLCTKKGSGGATERPKQGRVVHGITANRGRVRIAQPEPCMVLIYLRFYDCLLLSLVYLNFYSLKYIQ